MLIVNLFFFIISINNWFEIEETKNCKLLCRLDYESIIFFSKEFNGRKMILNEIRTNLHI